MEDPEDQGQDHETERPGRFAVFGMLDGLTRMLFLVPIVVIGLLTAIYFGLDSPAGHRLITRYIATVELESGIKFSVGRIEGSIYDRLSLHDIAVYDHQGKFMTAPKLEVDWSPFVLLRRHLDVQSLHAGRATLHRSPKLCPTECVEPLLPDLDIDIGKMRLDSLITEAAVTGEQREAWLAGTAHIADGRAQLRLDGAALAKPGAPQGDRIKLWLDAVPVANRLAMDLTIDAPKEGILAALSGLGAPLKVQLTGKGDWAKWDGKLGADYSGAEAVRLDLAARDGRYSLVGSARLAALLPAAMAAKLGQSAKIELKATPNQRRVSAAGTVTTETLKLSGAGTVDLAQGRYETVRLDLVPLKPSALIESLAADNARLKLELNGQFSAPQIGYALTARRLALNDLGMVELSATGLVTSNGGEYRIPLDARATRITGFDQLTGGALGKVRLTGDLMIRGPKILADNLRIRSDRLDAKARLLADRSSGRASGSLDGRLDQFRIESFGKFDLAAKVNLNTPDSGMPLLSGRLGARSTRIDNLAIRDFLGGDTVAAVNLSVGRNRRLQFSDLALKAPALQVTGGTGSYSANGQVALAAKGLHRDYGPIGLELSGTTRRPQAVVTADNPGLGIGLANLRATVLGADRDFHLDAVGDTDYGPLKADLLIALKAPLTLSINRATIGEVAFGGTLQRTQAGPFAGTLTALGSGLDGQATLSALGAVQAADLAFIANDAVLPGPTNLSIGRAIVDARVVLRSKPEIHADVQLAETRSRDLYLAKARAVIDYRDGKGNARLLAEGERGVPFRIAANAALQPRLWTAAIQGKVRGVDIRSLGPVRIIPGKDSYQLEPARFAIGQGSMQLAGSYGPATQFFGEFEKIDLSLLNGANSEYGFRGTATGKLQVRQDGNGSMPTGETSIQVRDFSRSSYLSAGQPIDLALTAKLGAGGGEARAVLRKRGEILGRINLDLRSLAASSEDWTESVLTAPLSGGVRYNGPAETMFGLLNQSNNGLSGRIGIAADFAGQIRNPKLDGIVLARNLTYENSAVGLRLTRLALSGKFSGDRLEIETLTATAGTGTISASGFAGFGEGSGYPIELRATLKEAQVANSDSLSALASGDLSLSKPAGGKAMLSGQIRLPRAQYQVMRQAAAEINELSGVRFKPAKGANGLAQAPPAASGGGLLKQLALDLQLVAPERLYVTGMGLDSEWRADLSIKGTAAAPLIGGQFRLLRGSVGFAGRSFDLSEGRIAFSDGQNNDPTISLAASEEVEDLTVKLSVTGRASKPQIAITSEPALPQDEILARVLFGSSIGNLSPLQAIQLATSLTALRGSGKSLSPLDNLRAATGLSKLRLLSADEAAGRGTALAAGSKITRNLYVELITDVHGFTATQLELSLSRTLSVLSQADGSGKSNINIRYRKNY